MTSQPEMDAAFAIVKEARRICFPQVAGQSVGADTAVYRYSAGEARILDLTAPFTRPLTWRERWRGTIMIPAPRPPQQHSPFSIEFQLLTQLRRLVKQYDAVVHKRRHDDHVRGEAEKVVRDLVMEGALKP